MVCVKGYRTSAQMVLFRVSGRRRGLCEGRKMWEGGRYFVGSHADALLQEHRRARRIFA